MVHRFRTLFVSAALLLALGMLMSSTSVVQAGETVNYEDFEPFLNSLQNGIDSAKSPSVSVESHDSSLDLDTDDPESLVDFVRDRAEMVKDGSGSIVDRKIQMIGEKALSICLGTTHGDNSSIAETTFCQGLESNLLTKLTVKDSDGNVIGQYRTIDS